MIEYPLLTPYAERYATLAYEPLTITLELVGGSRIAGYDPINLDNLLARCVVDEATGWQGLPNEDGAYNLPVPLQVLWRSEQGYPLYAMTPFAPAVDRAKDIVYWHKRAQTGRLTGTKNGKFIITPSKGRWVERRMPLPTDVCTLWQATCVGNVEEIARLVEPLQFIGKRRSIGFGEVRRWQIESAEGYALVADNKLTRSLPMMAVHLLDGYMPDGLPAPVGWTPPQWKPSLFAPGWWPGTACELDFYATSV